jgi:putative ubiquitin-RnfH superfamily antitoxin RatB of RatAB toxin-antitoxin module
MQQCDELTLHPGDKIQKAVNEFFSLFCIGNDRFYPISYHIPLEAVTVSNPYGYCYFTICVSGSIEGDITLNTSSSSSVRQFNSVPAMLDAVKIVDPRFLTKDNLVEPNDSLSKLLDNYLDSLECCYYSTVFPWLRDFLLTYLCKCVYSIDLSLLQPLPEESYSSYFNYSKDYMNLEVISKVFKPNTLVFKQEVVKKRQQLLIQGLKSKESTALSELIQAVLANLDPIPMNKTEIGMFSDHTNLRNYSYLSEEEKNEIVLASPKSNKRRRIENEESSDEDNEMLNYNNFVAWDEQWKGTEERILSNRTRKKLKLVGNCLLAYFSSNVFF